MDLYKIKTIAIISLASDDDLFDALVMKGGTALDTIYRVTNRQSIDIDYSMENDPFQNYEIIVLENKIKQIFVSEFKKNNYYLFDFSFKKKPKQPSLGQPKNWYGYRIEFKVILESNKAESEEKNRKSAFTLGKKEKKNFEIDISPFEFTEHRIKYSIDDYNVYVYTPEMILIEKLRSICQQMDEYTSLYKSGIGKGRAKDFYDICLLFDKKLVIVNKENTDKLKLILNGIFMAKNVDLNLLSSISKYKNLHESDFASVKSTVGINEKIEEFDYYFEKVLSIVDSFKKFRII